MHIQRSAERRRSKLGELVGREGYDDLTDMLREAMADGLCPSISKPS